MAVGFQVAASPRDRSIYVSCSTCKAPAYSGIRAVCFLLSVCESLEPALQDSGAEVSERLIVENLKSSSVGDWAELIGDAARCYLSPPVLWCPASRCWVEGRAPYAPLDPALWRVRMSSFLNVLEMHADGPGEFGIAEEGKEPVRSRRMYPSWERAAREVRYASGPVTRDLKEVLSGESVFRRESAITPERWLSLCDQSAAAFVSRRDLIAAFRRDCPHAVIGERAFLMLARQLFGRDGRFGPMGARGPWGFRVRLPR